MTDRQLPSVLWDLGGVLVEIDLVRSRSAFARETGLPEIRFDNAFFGSRLWEQMVIGAVDEAGVIERVNAFVERDGGTPMAPTSLFDMWNACLLPRAAVVDLIRRVALNVDVGVLSDTDPIHARFIQETAGVHDVMKSWTFSFDVGVRKPDPLIYRTACQSLGSEPENTLFIDDRVENVEGAREHGMDSFRFTSIEALTEQLERRGLL